MTLPCFSMTWPYVLGVSAAPQSPDLILACLVARFKPYRTSMECTGSACMPKQSTTSDTSANSYGTSAQVAEHPIVCLQHVSGGFPGILFRSCTKESPRHVSCLPVLLLNFDNQCYVSLLLILLFLFLFFFLNSIHTVLGFILNC